MSLKTLPILFLNMGGEMVYILDQRLQAQNVKQSKASRVLVSGDIVSTMFSKKFLDELFKPQELYSRKAMRTLFDKLAHASIMRLNTTSMDKLYDLMTMAVKYQLQFCLVPKDILVVTLNHLDGIRKLVQGAGNLQSLIDHAYNLLSENFFDMSAWELYMAKTTLLGYYQDARVKVSLFLREKKQKEDGRFAISTKATSIPSDAEFPGTIHFFQKGKPIKSIKFMQSNTYIKCTTEGSMAKTAKPGERSSDLGANIYRNATVDTQGGFGSACNVGMNQATKKQSAIQQELHLLSKLLGSSSKERAPAPDFSISLFDSREEEQTFIKEAEKAAQDVIKIDASKHKSTAAAHKLMEELHFEENVSKKSKGDEMLELMDNHTS